MSSFNQITSKEYLSDTIVKMSIVVNHWAPLVKAGQFLMIRTKKDGERFPLTIVESHENGVVIIFKIIGHSTKELAKALIGDVLYEVLGPLGKATDTSKITSMVVVGGGVGNAITYAMARHLVQDGVNLQYIGGFKNESDVFYVSNIIELCPASTFYVEAKTENYHQGNVIDGLKTLLKNQPIENIFCAGPLGMMKAVVDFAKENDIHIIVSLNPIMVDGIGMCGGCRVEVDHRVKFACVDGPEFDGRLINFEALLTRNQTYQKHECVIKKDHE
jgi:ferredoxin--NADP+ reductase